MLGSSERLSRLAKFFCWCCHGPYYWWSYIDKERDCCWLLGIVFVVGGGKPFKVLDCQYMLPAILLSRVVFPKNQIVELGQLTYYWLFGIDRAVLNAVNLILLIIANFKFEIQLYIIHSSLFCNILFQQRYIKNIINSLFFGQFELVNLFAYQV